MLEIECWLESLKAPNRETIDFQFPTESMRVEYLSTITTRSEFDIISLLRHFLLPSCHLGCDDIILKSHLAMLKAGRKVREF